MMEQAGTGAEQRLGTLYGRSDAHPLGKGLLACLVFGLGLWLGTSGVRKGVDSLPGHSQAEAGTPREKAAHWAAFGDEYDLVFVGSSRVYRQLIPKVFEEACGKRGLELNAFNWGLPGMRSYEEWRLVDELLANKPERLKWIVIEMIPWEPQIDWRNVGANREIQWHTPELTALAMRHTLSGVGGAPFKRIQLRFHAYQGAARFLNLGAVEQAWEQWQAPPGRAPDADYTGFMPLESDRTAEVLARREKFLLEVRISSDAVLDRVRAFRKLERSEQPARALVQQLEALQRKCKAAGVEPLFLMVPPVERLLPQVVGAFDAGVLPKLFHYADPKEFRAFYANKDLRYDFNHLNLNGAARLTRRFATDFVEHVNAESDG